MASSMDSDEINGDTCKTTPTGKEDNSKDTLNITPPQGQVDEHTEGDTLNTKTSEGYIFGENGEIPTEIPSMEFTRSSDYQRKYFQQNLEKTQVSKESHSKRPEYGPSIGPVSGYCGARPKVHSAIIHKSFEGQSQAKGYNTRTRSMSENQMNYTDTELKKAKPRTKYNGSPAEHSVDDIKKQKNNKKNSNENGNNKTSDRKHKKQPVTRVKEYLLYVVYEEKTKRVDHLKDFLQHRMGNPSNLNFNVKTDKMDQADQRPLIVLSFISANKQARGRSLLNRSNRNSSTKVHCFMTEDDARGVMRDRTNDKRSALKSIVEAAEKVFKTHDQKLEKSESKLENVNEKLHAKEVSLADFQILSDQKPALEDKVKELTKQRQEFVKYVQTMKTKIVEVRDKDYDKHMKEIRIAFGAECRRLEAALPIYACREEILTAVRNNQVCVVLGETGSGKSTQMVQYLYQAGYAEDGQIVCTQPRKIAASSLAQRVAMEMGSGVGQVVGYKVGMQAKISSLTKILFVTDHILLNDCLKYALLSQYSCVIIDEAHERSIFTDLLLGMLKKCLTVRPELRVIVTSATIDPGVFTAYFRSISPCPVLKVSGRVFPVDVFYEDQNLVSPFPDDYEKKALEKAMEVHRANPVEAGGILVFLTAPLETERCCEKFSQLSKTDDYQCLPLHGRLTNEQQQLVFVETKHGKRKIVFATNSAETSITIPGIRFVIDTGVAKEMQYDPKKNINSLCVVPISQSSANQRKGRAGRVSIGTCYRLYREAEFNTMDTIGKPEILRIHLSQGLLKLMELGVNPVSFDFVESPSQTALAAAIETLEELEAIKEGEITELGKWIAKLPVEPRLGALVKKGIDGGFPLETLVIAAFNNQKNIFFRVGSEEEKKNADMQKMKFCHEMGDVFTALNVYKAWNTEKETSKGKWCKINCINGKAMKNIRDMVKEIMTILQKEAGIKVRYEFCTDTSRDKVLQTLVFRSMMQNLCVFLGHEKAGYLTLRKKQIVQVHPSSALLSLGMQPTWAVFDQLLRTSADFITDVTPVTDELLDAAENDGILKLNRQSFLARQVREIVKIPIGRQVFINFVGPMHKNRRELEETISENSHGETIIIDANKIKGEISLYCRPEFSEVPESMIKQNILNVSMKLLRGGMEEPLSNEKIAKAFRALVGQGGAVQAILMPCHYRSVHVKVKDFCQYEITQEVITSMLSHYGTIADVWQPDARRRNTYPCWGKVTFVDMEAAEAAVADMEADKDCDIVLEPIKFDIEKMKPQDYTVKLRWCRRASRNHCFVYLNNPEDMTMLLVKGELHLDNSYFAPVCLAKKGADLMIRDLKSDVTEESVKKGLLDVLGLPVDGNDRRFKIIIPRENIPYIPMEASDIKHKLTLRVALTTPNARVGINIRDIKEKTAFCMAFLTFMDPVECEQVAADMNKHGLSINGKPVTVDMEFKSTTFLNRRVFKVLERDIFQFIGTWNNAGHSSNITHRENKFGNISLFLSATSPRELANLKASLDDVIDGEVFECDSGKQNHLFKIFTVHGKTEMQKIEKKFGVIVTVDERTMKVTVQGLVEHRHGAVVEINKYLEKVGAAREIEIPLKGNGNPPGFMKALLTKYGIGLKKLIEKHGLVSLKLNIRYHEVTICGYEDGLKKTADAIDDVKKDVAEGRFDLPNDDLPDCPVCLCAVELHDMCRLEYCGHAYCSVCLTMQIENAVQSKEFPIKCAHEDCEEPLVVRDLTTQFRQGLIKRRQLVDAAVSDFVTKNKDEYRYCTTPDCKIVYPVTTTSSLFSCPICLRKLCTKCHTGYHEGITCEMNKSATRDGNSMLKWLQEKPQDRKLCPKCHVGIEKAGGCQHMTCKCGVHICWICMEYFLSSGACYGHLSSNHNTFV